MNTVVVRVQIIALFAFILALVFATFFSTYNVTQAQQVDAAANAMCQTMWSANLAACKEKGVPCANAKTMGKPCAGPACSGTCNFPMGGGGTVTVCGGEKCGNQPEGASDAGAGKAMDMAKQLMDALKGKAGGGGGGAPSDFAASTYQPPAQARFDAGGFASDESPLASFTQTATERVSNAAANLFSTIFGGGDVAPPPPPAEEEGQEPAVGGTKTGTDTGPRAGQGGRDGGVAEGPPGQAPAIGGIAGFFSRFFDIDEQPGRIAEGQSFFHRLCTSRAWQATFIARVFSAGFFDSLCAEQGNAAEGDQFVFDPSNSQARYARLVCPTKVKVGEGATIAWDCGGSQSAGFGFDTGGRASGSVIINPEDIDDYFLRCGNGGRAQGTIDVERTRGPITAYPP